MFFLPPPIFTEGSLPDQTGRVHIVTGGYSGIGLELVKVLYGKNAVVYIIGRSSEKARQAISNLQRSAPLSSGRLEFIACNFADLADIKPAAHEFMDKEQRLDVLTNNAGVFIPPKAILTAQGRDMQMGVNSLSAFLLTLCLLPILKRTAATSPPGSVRVTWASSMAVTVGAPTGGIVWDPETLGPDTRKLIRNYTHSKVGMLYLAAEMCGRYGGNLDGGKGVLSIAWDPGNVASQLTRHVPRPILWFMKKTYLYPLSMGVYSPLFAGWSTDVINVGQQRGEFWVIPWGRMTKVRSDLLMHLKRKSEGGGGDAERFWLWCETETRDFF